MKYNIWVMIEKADEENETYEDLKDTQRLIISLDNEQDALNHIKELAIIGGK